MIPHEVLDIKADFHGFDGLGRPLIKEGHCIFLIGECKGSTIGTPSSPGKIDPALLLLILIDPHWLTIPDIPDLKGIFTDTKECIGIAPIRRFDCGVIFVLA